MQKLLLASTSPTRKKILINAGIKFIYKTPLINEEHEKKKINNMNNPEKACQRLAKQKSIKTSLKYPSYLVLGADTCLIYKKKFLSKPKTKKMAKRLLTKLKGKEHKIYSSLYISKKGKKIWNYNDEARLKIRKLTKKEISRYIYKLKLKKIQQSGLYQIENSGITLFEKIEGSYFTILGLPLIPLLKFLNKKRFLI
jgi:septum formation protein